MRVALITTAPSVRSGIGDYTRSWLAEFAKLAEVEVFVERATAGQAMCGSTTRDIGELAPREFDRIVYQLGNEIAHAFMTPLVKRIGGTVVLHDWVLFDQAVAAYPELARGGIAGHVAALREGGIEQFLVYAANRADKRAAERSAPQLAQTGTLLAGWHASEANGRWTEMRAFVRLPTNSADALRVRIGACTGRALRIALDGTRIADVARDRELFEVEFGRRNAPIVELATRSPRTSEEQRENGDPRRLGTFVRGLEFRDERGWHALDLRATAELAAPSSGLDRDRFRLPFNRSIVRDADSFVVHSEFVKSKIAAERGAKTPIGVVHHGAEPHWRETDRREMRADLGLGESFRRGFLATSFGHVQAHKRVEPLLEAFALARAERDDLHLALIGSLDPAHFDARAIVARLGLERFVHFTDYVTENEARDWIHAGDLAVQLRGPSTGGSSGGVFQSLALGRGVIATDQDEQSELPKSCVLEIAPGPNEVRELAKLLVSLRDDPARRAALEAGARAFVRDECSWKRSAERYFALLERFPKPRSAR